MGQKGGIIATSIKGVAIAFPYQNFVLSEVGHMLNNSFVHRFQLREVSRAYSPYQSSFAWAQLTKVLVSAEAEEARCPPCDCPADRPEFA